MLRIRILKGALTAALFAVVMAGSAFAGGHVETFAEAKALSTERGVPILVDFYATWCGPCKRFDKDLESIPELSAYLEDMVFLSLDAEKGEGLELAKVYSVVNYPTYLVCDATGATIDRWLGYEDSESFIQLATQSLEDPTPVATTEALFAAEPTAERAEYLADYRMTRGEYAEAITLYQRSAELAGNEVSTCAFQIFDAHARGHRKEIFSTAEVTKAADAVFESESAGTLDRLTVGYEMIAVARRDGNMDLAVPYLKSGMEAAAGSEDEDVVALRDHLGVDHAILVQKDPEAALALKRNRMSEGWMKNPQALNNFAWWCFENKVNLEEAEKLARLGVELAEPGPDKAMILDTAAEICLARGGCQDAVALAERAVEEDPGKKYYVEQLGRFRQALAAVVGGSQ